MNGKENEHGITVAFRLDKTAIDATLEGVKQGKSLNKSDYWRDAIRRKLRADGLIV